MNKIRLKWDLMKKEDIHALHRTCTFNGREDSRS